MSEQLERRQDHDSHTEQDHKNNSHHDNNRVSMISLNRHDRKRLAFALPMLVAGGVALLFSYIYNSLILTFIGLGLAFWGSVLYYITSARYYPEELFRVVVEAYSKSISTTLSRLGYNTGSTTASVLFYPRQLKLGGLTQGYILIYKNGILTEGNTIQLSNYLEEWDGHDSSKGMGMPTATTPVASTHASQYSGSGMLIKAPAQGLIDLFESRLNVNFALMSMDELEINLERLFMEEFMLADSVEISKDDDGDDDTVKVTVRGRDTARICSSMHGISTALCPVCSSIALAIGKSTGKAVMVKESIVGKRRVDTTYSLLEMV
ncbi:MAG: hypothetical protein QW248_05285 [Candidatus Nitrosocaldus sp.]